MRIHAGSNFRKGQPIADIAYSQPKIKGPPIKGPIRKEAPALQLGLSVGWRRKVSARTELNQPLVTTGAGALPLPMGASFAYASREAEGESHRADYN